MSPYNALRFKESTGRNFRDIIVRLRRYEPRSQGSFSTRHCVALVNVRNPNLYILTLHIHSRSRSLGLRSNNSIVCRQNIIQIFVF